MSNMVYRFRVKTLKEMSILFHRFYEETAELSFFSTGENQGLPIDKIFDKFLKSDSVKGFIPMGFNEQLEASEKEISLLVENNNSLKDKVEKMELIIIELKKLTQQTS